MAVGARNAKAEAVTIWVEVRGIGKEPHLATTEGLAIQPHRSLHLMHGRLTAADQHQSTDHAPQPEAFPATLGRVAGGGLVGRRSSVLVVVGQVMVHDSGQMTEKTDFLRTVPTTPCDSDAIAEKAASAGDSAVVVPTSAAAETAADWAAGR